MRRTRKNHSPSTYASAEIAVYDGISLIGSYAPHKSGFADYDHRGRGVGIFGTKDQPRLAIEAAREKARGASAAVKVEL